MVWAQAMLEPEKLDVLCQANVQPFTAMDELNDFRDRVMTHTDLLWSVVFGFPGLQVPVLFGEKADPMPMVSMFTGSVSRKLRKILHRA